MSNKSFPTMEELKERLRAVSQRMLREIPTDPQELRKHIGKVLHKAERLGLSKRRYRFCPHCGKHLL